MVIASYEVPTETFPLNSFTINDCNACPFSMLEFHFGSIFKINPTTCGSQKYDTKLD